MPNEDNMLKVKSAKGVEGFLIYCADGKYRFRVYDKQVNDDGFIDYDILHYDLHVQILDDDAFFVADKYLDHSLVNSKTEWQEQVIDKAEYYDIPEK